MFEPETLLLIAGGLLLALVVLCIFLAEYYRITSKFMRLPPAPPSHPEEARRLALQLFDLFHEGDERSRLYTWHKVREAVGPGDSALTEAINQQIRLERRMAMQRDTRLPFKPVEAAD